MAEEKQTAVKPFLRHLHRSMAQIRRTYLRSRDGTETVSEWLSDNYFLLHRTYEGVVESLSPVKYLPESEDGIPRIYAYAAEFCRMTGCDLKGDALDRYMESVGERVELRNEEIRLFPDMFRFALLVRIAERCERRDRDGELRHAIRSVRTVGDLPFDDLFERISRSERILARDPWYHGMDRETKNLYRHRLSVLAEAEGVSECELARRLLRQARSAAVGHESHIGYALLKRQKQIPYRFLSVFVPSVLAAVTGILCNSFILAVLSLFPMWEICKILLDRICARAVRPVYTPRMEITEDNCPKTLVSITTLFSDTDSVDRVLHAMERYALANPISSIKIGFLADLPPSETERCDSDKVLLEYVRNGLRTLNRKYNGRFFGAIRARRQDIEDGMYRGRERKRGAICDFLDAVRSGDDHEFLLLDGDMADAVYLVTLDSDTRPDIDSIRSLIGVMEHPLAAPVFNADATRVEQGYAIAAPRMDVRLTSANTNGFTKIIGGFGGVELYGNPSSDLYQDLYGEGIFAGKGILRIDCFRALVSNVFPPRRILSHDILEGGFLRTAYVSDVAFSDNVPKNVLSYGERNHRWIRGDWQNLPYLCKTVMRKGRRIENPLNGLSRYKLFDNLRRSLFAPWSLVCTLLTLFDIWIPFFLTLVAYFLPFVLTLAGEIGSFGFLHTARYRSAVIPVLTQSFLQGFLPFCCMPYFAVTALDAVIRACYRQIRGVKLLEWTTADQADGRIRGTLLEYWRKMYPQGLGLLFGLQPAMLAVGILWISAPFLCWYLTVAKRKEASAPDIEKAMSDMWGYFADFLNAKNHWLPPDNFQESPLGVEASRTSPTNIGIAMLSALGAWDMGYLSKDDLFGLLNRMLDSVERLETWQGHLLNWYSTVTLKPLYPRYVSTVDNGNYLCFLYALRNGLKEFADPEAVAIGKRIEKILTETDLSLLYHKKKDLFHIGYDVEQGTFSESYYDIYVSEARLTSFYAIATGQVPKKHWYTMSRLMTKRHGLWGIKSWTGTMFEYFMPHLLLPAYDHAVSGELLRFACAEQRKRDPSLPWGVSECAYHSFDRGLHYQYKAVGVPSLALKKGMEADHVVAPYATWLTLPFFPRIAEENLRRLERLGMYGKYGFYEAYDATLSRTGGVPAVVRTFMVHHIGMSFLSGINALKDGRMQKRFTDARMDAFSQLLEEKLPYRILPFDERQSVSPKKERYAARSAEYTVQNPDIPNVKVLSDGTFSSVLTDSGWGWLKTDDTDLTRRRMSSAQPKGSFILCRSEGQVFSLSFAPLYDSNVRYKVFFDDCEAVFYAKSQGLESRMSVLVHPKYHCEVREVCLKNSSVSARDCELLFYTEPVLCAPDAERSHPAFADLFTESEYDPETKILFFCRRTMPEESAPLWLAVSTSVPFSFHTDRTAVLDRLCGVRGLQTAFDKPFGTDAKDAVSPCAALRCKVDLRSRETATVRFYTAMGRSRKEAAEHLLRTAAADCGVMKRACENRLFADYDQRGINREDIRLCEIVLSSIFGKHTVRGPLRYKNTLGIEHLWQYGISGDEPLILVRTDETSVEGCIPFLKMFGILRRQAVDCDLAFCFSEGARYDQPVMRKLREYLRRFDLEGYYGKRRGIFFLNVQKMEDLALLTSVCLFYADLETGWRPRQTARPYRLPRRIRAVGPKLVYTLKTGVGGFVQDGFGLDDKQKLANRPPWCHCLSNRVFGTVVSDSSLGYTYAFNARQNKLTPWENDRVCDNRGEMLTVQIGDAVCDPIEGASAVFYRSHAEYRAQVGNVRTDVTVFVPVKHYAKILRVRVENAGPVDVTVRYEPQIIMGVSDTPDTLIREREDDAVYLSNNLNTAFRDGCACLFGVGVMPVGGGLCGTVARGSTAELWFVLGYGRTRKQARRLVMLLSSAGRLAHELRKVTESEDVLCRIETPDKRLDSFCNTFLTHQIIRCRLYARTGFYQCGGAFGFRDQLQDALCLATVAPRYLKQQLLLCAAHQFEEGDVMHWWHPSLRRTDPPKGVRSRSSDDLLWLPFAACEYWEKTGDMTLFAKQIPYLRAPLLRDGEDERYLEAAVSEVTEPLYRHCVRALLAAVQCGEHGLLCFGSGDWNDGMNRVGGETVWGSLFAVWTLERFSDVATRFHDGETELFCRKHARMLRNAVETHAWDGDWYLRGYFRNGNPLGSAQNEECRIDLLPQVFAALCGGFDEKRVRTALASADRELTDRNLRLVRLFTPPFHNSPDHPGYIMRYPAGVRENGGQYTHAAVWYAMALFRMGDGDGGYEILRMLNPAEHCRTADEAAVFRVEPYVLSGDVYANDDMAGMGGWSHYTGSAGWYFKVVTECLLGICRKGDRVTVHPCLPRSWDGCKATVRIGSTVLLLELHRGERQELTVDGVPARSVPLDGKPHRVNVATV